VAGHGGGNVLAPFPCGLVTSTGAGAGAQEVAVMSCACSHGYTLLQKYSSSLTIDDILNTPTIKTFSSLDGY
jgi:hypothetical protein